jgi:hypothetical protein
MLQLDTRGLLRDEASAAQGRAQLFPGSLPLQEVRQAQSGGHVEFMVTVGDGSDETSYLIEDAVGLYSRQAGEAHHGLRIDGNHGRTTLIEFRKAAQAETLDGLANSRH